jgi:hypothetical protein
MRTLVLLVLAAGCLGEPEYDLDDVRSQLVAWAEVDVGVPDALATTEPPLFFGFDDPDMGCFFLDSSATLSLDGMRAMRTVIEG